jgi:hypothetical protein
MLWDDFNSQANIDSLQAQIISYVKKQMNVTIPAQNQPDLMNLMRAVYSQDPRRSLMEINQAVVEKAFAIIQPGVNQAIYYKGNVGTIPAPMAHPVNMSTTGTKSGEVQIGLKDTEAYTSR